MATEHGGGTASGGGRGGPGEAARLPEARAGAWVARRKRAVKGNTFPEGGGLRRGMGGAGGGRLTSLMRTGATRALRAPRVGVKAAAGAAAARQTKVEVNFMV